MGPGRNTREHRCMCPPAPAVPSGLLHPVLAWILPADSREATGHQEQVAVGGGARR